jgi:pyrroline-5-carboxylate reductase
MSAHDPTAMDPAQPAEATPAGTQPQASQPVVLQVVGGGRMGQALVAGLLSAGWARPQQIQVVEVDADRRAALAQALPGVVVTAEVGPAAGAVLAVKPADTVAACGALANHGVTRVLSIAAGVPTARMEAAFDTPVAVVRAMPNTPAQVGVGASAIAAGTHADDDDLVWAESILDAVGVTVRVDEPLLDAVTGLSGSGPAYVFLLVEALIDAGIAEGLPADVAGQLVVQTVAGAARILQQSGAMGLDAADHRRAVTSPNGTTAAGLAVLDQHQVRQAVSDAVAAAASRSRQLGSA